MSIDALLNNKPIQSKYLDDLFVKRFTVAEYLELKDSLSFIAKEISKTDDPLERLEILFTSCFADVCVLIAMSTDIEPSRLINTTPEVFQGLLSEVMETNADFFIRAARHQ